MLSSLVLIVVLVVCAACGTNTGGQGGQSSPVAATPLPTQNCGALHGNYAGLLPTDKASAEQDENCFFNAYKQCHPATLTYQVASLDTGSIHHFAVKASNSSCSLSDGLQRYIAPKPPRQTITYPCASASMGAYGLRITACGEAGDVVIPLK
jgi:hypothetical protein